MGRIEVAVKRFSDWTRLLPRKEGTTNQERVSYLVDFLTRRRGSSVSAKKAIKELSELSQNPITVFMK